MGRLMRKAFINREIVGFAEGGCRLDGIEGFVALMVEGLGVESFLFFKRAVTIGGIEWVIVGVVGVVLVIARRGGPETADEETFRLVAETETVFLGGVVDGAEGGGVISEEEGDLEVFEVGFGVLVHRCWQ
jgi:hypothetical protein